VVKQDGKVLHGNETKNKNETYREQKTNRKTETENAGQTYRKGKEKAVKRIRGRSLTGVKNGDKKYSVIGPVHDF